MTVKDYNEKFQPRVERAECFVNQFESAIRHMDDAKVDKEEVRYHFAIRNWDEETKQTILEALKCYDQHEGIERLERPCKDKTEITFEKVKNLFNGLSPEEYVTQIKTFQSYLDALSDDFGKEYTYCTGCKQYVKKKEKYVEESKNKRFIRCNKCNTIWYIRYYDEPLEEDD